MNASKAGEFRGFYVMSQELENENELPRNTFSVSSLPKAFLNFLDDNGIDPSVYSVTNLPRYVRLNTGLAASSLPSAQELKEQLNARRVWEVQGMNGFFGMELEQDSVRLVD